MIGLEFIAQTFNIKYATIAEALGVNRTTVHDWLKGKRKIPKKRITELASYFGLPEEYFQKELNSVERLNVLQEKIYRASEEVELEQLYLDDNGNQHKYIVKHNISEAEISFLEDKKRKEEILMNARALLDESDLEVNDCLKVFINYLKDPKTRRLMLLIGDTIQTNNIGFLYANNRNKKEEDFTDSLKELLIKFGC